MYQYSLPFFVCGGEAPRIEPRNILPLSCIPPFWNDLAKLPRLGTILLSSCLSLPSHCDYRCALPQACLALHSFLWLNNILLYGYTKFCLLIHLLMDIWIVCTFGVLSMMLQGKLAFKYLVSFSPLFFCLRFHWFPLFYYFCSYSFICSSFSCSLSESWSHCFEALLKF